MQALSQVKPVKLELGEGLQIRLGDEIKQMLDPIYLGLLKPLVVVAQPFEQIDQIETGRYFYFPFFSDTRIYKETLDHLKFTLFMEDFQEIQDFIQSLLGLIEKYPAREDLQTFHSGLHKYSDQLKKHSEDMRWKEASKVRKLKSQIRSKKM